MKQSVKNKLFIFCTTGMILCVLLLGVTFYLEYKDKSIQQYLQNLLNQDSVASEEYLAKYDELYQENNDFVGWIKVEDTQIDYPVMHTPNDAEYYLRKDFYGDYSIAGTLFASWNCTFNPRSDNIILYGHNMNNGTMFADLINYQKQEYWQEHSLIQFDTLYTAQTYQIVYAFIEDVGINKEHFEFYNFIDFTEETFDYFIENCINLSLYDTESNLKYGDDLLTLVTCIDYSSTQRMVVVAKAIN